MPRYIKDLIKPWPPRSWATHGGGILWNPEKAVIESLRLGEEKFFLKVKYDEKFYTTTIFLRDVGCQEDFKKVYQKLSGALGLTLDEAGTLKI